MAGDPCDGCDYVRLDPVVICRTCPNYPYHERREAEKAYTARYEKWARERGIQRPGNIRGKEG